MPEQTKKLADLFIRYAIILLVGLGNLYIFYKLLTPATIQTVAFISNLFTKTAVTGNLIISSKVIIEIIPACVAGSAYYLLFILAISVPQIKLSKRVKILALSFISLFILNIARIFLLTATNNTTYFEATHIIFWYLISTIFVVAIWITAVKIFKIKSIPIYSDLKFLYSLVNRKKPKRRK